MTRSTRAPRWTALEIPGRQAAADLENRTQVLAGQTADALEAMMAFAEKRTPDFKNA